MTPEHSPEHVAKQAAEKIEGKTLLVRKCKQRRQKFAAIRDRTQPSSAKHKRAVRKYRFWSRRMHDAIYLKFHWKHVLADALEKIANRKPARLKLLAEAEKSIGAKEGGSFHRKAAEFVGALLGWPWCSTAVAYWLHLALGWLRQELPDNAPYSGCWVASPVCKRVAIRKRKDGHILIHDWGDGGMTDHVSIKDGPERIGGNQDDEVNRRPENPETIVFVCEPRGRK